MQLFNSKKLHKTKSSLKKKNNNYLNCNSLKKNICVGGNGGTTENKYQKTSYLLQNFQGKIFYAAC